MPLDPSSTAECYAKKARLTNQPPHPPHPPAPSTLPKQSVVQVQFCAQPGCGLRVQIILRPTPKGKLSINLFCYGVLRGSVRCRAFSFFVLFVLLRGAARLLSLPRELLCARAFSFSWCCASQASVPSEAECAGEPLGVMVTGTSTHGAMKERMVRGFLTLFFAWNNRISGLHSGFGWPILRI